MQHRIREDIENNTRRHVYYRGRVYYRIPSAPDYFISDDGHVYSQLSDRELIPRDNGTRYLRVWINGRPRYIHRLVYETFVGPIPDGLQINHIDHNTHNNNLDNLELVSQRENNNKKAIHETIEELPPEAVELPQFNYQTPRNVYNIQNLYYFDNRVYEKFDTCYRRINPDRQGHCRTNGTTLSLNKLIQLIEQLVRNQRRDEFSEEEEF